MTTKASADTYIGASMRGERERELTYFQIFHQVHLDSRYHQPKNHGALDFFHGSEHIKVEYHAEMPSKKLNARVITKQVINMKTKLPVTKMSKR